MAVKAETIAQNSTNPFLRGNFAPVSDENFVTELKVSGAIPKELNGLLLRIGPNPASSANPKSYHWFMGTGMVHGLRLGDGKAHWYRNNFIVDKISAAILNRKVLPTPVKKRGGGVNTNVMSIGGELFALVEAGDLPIKLNENLESIECSNFQNTLKHGFSAHPRLDPASAELHVIAYEPGKKSVDYLVVDKKGQSRCVAQLPLPHQPMIHDAAITSSSLVVLDLPFTLNLVTAISGKFPYVWNKRQQPRIGLLPRSGNVDQLQWFEAPSCYVYHIMNAYDSGANTIVDVVKNSIYFGADILKTKNSPLSLVRWTLNHSTGKLTESQLSDYPSEFPRVNDAYIGRQYRFGYTAHLHLATDLKFGNAYKHDLLKGTTMVHQFGRGKAGMEPVFVAKNEAKLEDDGWLLAYVYDETSNLSEVVIWEAQDFEEKVPVATIHLPVRVPFGFHGNWIAD